MDDLAKEADLIMVEKMIKGVGLILIFLGAVLSPIQLIPATTPDKKETAQTYFNKGNEYFAKSQYSLALEAYNKALKLNQQYAEAYLARGKCYVKMRNLDLAIADYTKAVELNPSFAEVYKDRGIAFHEKNQRALAFADFTKYRELIKKSPKPEKDNIQVRIMVFDLETKRSVNEVGGWGNKDKMGMAMAMVWDSRDQKFYPFKEAEVEKLMQKLKQADLVVGFELKNFDYKVLSAYPAFDSWLPTFDIYEDLTKRDGIGIGLNDLAQPTLNQKKSADAKESLGWVKEGKLDKVEEYCRKDVELTRDLFNFGLENRYFIYINNQGEPMPVILDWELEKIIENSKPQNK